MTDTKRLVHFAFARSAVNPGLVYLVITNEDDIDSASYALLPDDLNDLRQELSLLGEKPND